VCIDCDTAKREGERLEIYKYIREMYLLLPVPLAVGSIYSCNNGCSDMGRTMCIVYRLWYREKRRRYIQSSCVRYSLPSPLLTLAGRCKGGESLLIATASPIW